jgi:predicted transcriptional regulator
MALKNAEKSTVTFRIPLQKRSELDRIAGESLRNRSFVLNEAVDAYLETMHWQVAHIEEGLHDANTGRFAGAKEIASAYRGQ